MQLHNIQPNTKNKKKKRVGRGGKRGTYSGKGLKGQKSRAGRKLRPELRDIIKKIPKKRGYKFQSFQEKTVVLNLKEIERKLDGVELNPKKLLELGLIKKIKGKMPKIKILGDGSITKKLLVSGCQISKQAREKIEKEGGKIND